MKSKPISDQTMFSSILREPSVIYQESPHRVAMATIAFGLTILTLIVAVIIAQDVAIHRVNAERIAAESGLP